jgi:hypothetical protein
MQLINQAAAALWFPEGITSDEKANRIVGAVALLRGINPVDEIEGLLATQMVATHSAAMECLRRAIIPGQTLAGCEQNWKHAAKLLSIYTRQMDALNKHRGKGQQKVTVEYVNVEAGGQAVVGHVETAQNPPSPVAQSIDAPKAITHTPGETLDLKSRARTPAKQRNK